MNSIVAITSPAANTRLTTLDRVKRELSIEGDDDDDLLTEKIDEATSDIAFRVRPSLKRETLTETFWHEDRWTLPRYRIDNRPLILSRYPVASIGSVTLDGIVTDAAQYRLDPDAGLLYRLDASSYPSRWYFAQQAVVVYGAGYTVPDDGDPTLPASLQAAAIELLASYWASRGRDPLLKSEENMGVARFDYWVGAIGQTGDLPPGVMAKIAPFRTGGYL